MRMKAQSGLAGDRKKQAEMTCSRVSGVTTRITGISETMSEAVKALHVPALDLPKIEFAPEFVSALEGLSVKKLCDAEVNHRPAGQRCPVCTP